MSTYRGMYSLVLTSNMLITYLHYKVYKKATHKYPAGKNIEPFYIY